MITIILILFVLYFFLFLASIYLKDNGIADVFWGFGFMVIAGFSFLFYSDENMAQITLTFLIFLWGSRLSFHIGMKNLQHVHEDARYAAWRKEWKNVYLRSFFQVYMLQGFFMCVIATPIFLINLHSGFDSNIFLSLLGLVVALFGIFYETKADGELAQFMKHKKKGEILTEGLRKYHRYPQYFGESVFWFGVCIIASQISIFAFIGWIVITLLLRYVSGVPLLEKRYEGHKKYGKYSKTTNIFFPDWTLIFKK